MQEEKKKNTPPPLLNEASLLDNASNLDKANSLDEANPLWGGHFSTGPSQIMAKINQSIGFDYKLYKEDIEGSIAHAKMLAKQKIISSNDSQVIIDGLKQIKKDISLGKFEFKNSLEDIHMNIEARLQEIIGEPAGRLHTARSRNDQVATDFKLYVRKALENLDTDLKKLQAIILNKAEEHFDTIMPGYTHLQTAQPVTFGHHMLAYFEMILRDRTRCKDALTRMNECPLGSAALAGTSFDTDRFMTARLLGFTRPTANSIDSVSDRDFAIEFLSICSICAMHLSRLAEEIIIWSSAEFAFIKLSDSYTTGSSIMPQKRNPDAAELVRGKTGRIYGSLMSLLTVMKGLPLTYSKDMQEDKECLFDTAETISLLVAAMGGMIADMEIKKDKMYQAALRGFSTATDLADWLVKNLAMPFRRAHLVVGKIVKLAENNNCRLDELHLQDLQQIEPKINESAMEVLKIENSVASRKSYGGTAPSQVIKSIEEARKKYGLQ